MFYFFFCFVFPFSNSITIDHSPNGPNSKLFIKSVQVHDEEIYTCGITYLDPSDSCDSSGSHKIKLNVLGLYWRIFHFIFSMFESEMETKCCLTLK